jgi:hypothetical protein
MERTRRFVVVYSNGAIKIVETQNGYITVINNKLLGKYPAVWVRYLK